MSVISPLADDLALVYAPLLPAAFYQLLKARGIRLVEGDAGRVPRAATGSASTCCRRRPREVIAVAGFPKTEAAMEAAGCTVADLRGRCAVHRLRRRPDLPDPAGAAPMTATAAMGPPSAKP